MPRCPTRDELRDFAAGRLSVVAAAATAGHLSRCQACLALLGRMSDSAEPTLGAGHESAGGGSSTPDQGAPASSASLDAPRSDAEDSAALIGGPSPADASLTESPTWPTARTQRRGPLSIRCPQCRAPIELPDDALATLTCPDCGEHFALASEEPAVDTGGRIGHFELLQRLGQGSFGTVWKARDTQLGRVVALKIARRGPLEQIAPLLHEARAAAQVEHPNIVGVHEVGCQNDQFFIVSDYIEGRSLHAWLAGQPVPPREAAAIGLALAEALQVAHESGVVHRDLKPGNILIDRAGKPHLTDFGLAKHKLGSVTITLDGRLLGTPAYMSPEQARGRATEVDARSDIYSLGVILYEMLAGRTPFQGDLRMLVAQILFDDPPPIARLVAHVPRDVETIALKCLEKLPARRYQTAAELAEDLRRFLDGQPIQARPVGRIARAWRWCRRRPATVALLAALALVIAGAAAAISASHWRTVATLRTVQEQSYFDRLSTASQEWLANDRREALTALKNCPEELRGFEWSYLERLFHSPETKLQAVNGVFAFSPDGRRICTDFSARPGLQFWDAATGRQTGGTINGQAWTSSLEYSPDGQMIITDDQVKRTLCLRRAVDGRLIRTFGTHRREVLDAHFSFDGRHVISWGRDNAVRVWESETGEAVATIQFAGRRVRWITVSPVDDRVAVSTGRVGDGRLEIWDARTGTRLHEIPTGGAAVTGLAFSPDGQVLATAQPHGAIQFWRLNPVHRHLIISSRVAAYPRLTFDPEGKRIAAEAEDGSIRIWDVAEGTELRALRGHLPPTANLKFSPDGSRLAATARDQALLVWDTTTDQGTVALRGGETPVIDLDFDARGSRLVGTFKDGAIGLWDTATGARLWMIPAEESRAARAAFSPDGRTLAVAANDATVRILDAVDGRPVFQFRGHAAAVRAVDFSPDGKWVASSGGGGQVIVWDAATGKTVRSRTFKTVEIRTLAFHPDGNRLAVGARDRFAAVWDLATDEIAWQSNAPALPVWDVAWSPDGKTLAVTHNDGAVVLHDALGGMARHQFGVITREYPVGLSFTPDGKRVAVAAAHKVLKLFEVPTGRTVLDLRRDPAVAGAVVFDPTGRILAGGQIDGTIILWPTADAIVGHADSGH